MSLISSRLDTADVTELALLAPDADEAAGLLRWLAGKDSEHTRKAYARSRDPAAGSRQPRADAARAVPGGPHRPGSGRE